MSTVASRSLHARSHTISLVAASLSLCGHVYAQQSSTPPDSSTASSQSSSRPSAWGPSQRQYVEIPTSTIIAIGLGFLGFAFIVLTFLLSVRIKRLRAIARRSGRSFRHVWRNEGGCWGFLTSLGGGDGSESELIGAGGASERSWALRVLRERERERQRSGWGLDDKWRPEIWDVGWYASKDDEEDEGGAQEDQSDEEILRQLKPLSLRSSAPPPRSYSTIKPPPDLPHIDLCVLISLPSESPYDSTSEELPTLVIGTTGLVPMVCDLPSVSSSDEKPISMPTSMVTTSQTDMGEKGAVARHLASLHGISSGSTRKVMPIYKDGIEIEQIEYAGPADPGTDTDTDLAQNGNRERNGGLVDEMARDPMGHERGLGGGLGRGPQRRAEWKKGDKGRWAIEGL